jgi:hypothetical protein
MIILSLLILLSMQFYIFYITTFQHTRYISNLIRSVLYHFMVLCYVLWCGGVCKIVHTILDVEMMLLHVKCFTWHATVVSRTCETFVTTTVVSRTCETFVTTTVVSRTCETFVTTTVVSKWYNWQIVETEIIPNVSFVL